MKKILLVVCGILVAVLLCVLGLAAGRPDEVTYQRSITISAPREKIFEQINNYNNWMAWSPWEKKDPNMKSNLSGPE